MTNVPLQTQSPCGLENEMHVQLLLEAKNDAQAINDSNPNDSIMSGPGPSTRFPGRVKVDQKMYDSVLGPEAAWMKNMSIVSGI